MAKLRAPLVLASLAYLAGLLVGLRLAWVLPWTGWMAIPVALAPVLLPAWRERHTFGAILAALALVGAGQGAWARLGSRVDCRALLPDDTPVSVRGALAANFVPPAEEDGRIPLLPVRVDEVSARGAPLPGCGGELRVRLPRGTPAMLAGTTLEVEGAWWRMPAPVTPSRWPRDAAYLGYVFARRAGVTAPPSFAAHPLLTMRGRTERAITRLFPRNAALADALLLGRRETLDRDLADRFARSGLVHLLAISGSHVALIGAVLLLLGRVARIPRNRAIGATIALVTLYLAMIGAPPSAVRSGIMMALALAGVVLQRPSDPLPIVAAAALAILALQPISALDIGFQLSFAGVLGLILLRRAMLRRLPERWREGKWRRPLADSLVTSVAAFLTTAPIVAEHFGQVAPVSIVANLPAIPLTSLALVGIGAALVSEPFVPPLARLFADGASTMLDLLSAVVDLAVRVPGGHAAVSRPQWALWAVAAAVFLLVMDAAARLRDGVRWTLAGMTACAAFLILPLAAPPSGAGLEIAFLDVGQGDAVAIRTPAGRFLLVDAGPADDRFDAGERRVLPFLRARGATRVEALVLTHPHADHIGGAGAVLRGLPVGRVIEPGLPFGSPVYRDLLEVVRERGVEWSAARQDRALLIDGVELTFLWPTPESLDSPPDANDISAVLLLRYGEFRAVLTGDAPSEVEARLIRRYGAGLRAQLLKAGHHGSRTATSEPFLHAVQPELVVISCGVRNRYGHPAPETMARIARAGVPVARTDREGTVVVHVAPGGASWNREGP